MLDHMPEVVTLSRPERLGPFVVRLTSDADAHPSPDESRLRRELEAKILTHFAEAIRGQNGVPLQVVK